MIRKKLKKKKKRETMPFYCYYMVDILDLGRRGWVV